MAVTAFDLWLLDASRWLLARCGVGAAAFPAFDWRGLYEAGEAPEWAAFAALDESGLPLPDAPAPETRRCAP